MQNTNLANVGSSYSKIINPESYNRLMTEEHLYIAQADRYIESIIKDLSLKSLKKLNVVEIGCGPARITGTISSIHNLNLLAIDLDENFIDYAAKLLPHISFLNKSIIDFKSPVPVDVFYSQGFHHHLEKGEKTLSYLRNVHNQLTSGGYYIVGDEFIPDYNTESERDIRLVIWYSHVIAHAIKKEHSYLAQEEAKTLLDDINEGKKTKRIKSQDQLDIVLSSVTDIDNAAKKDDITTATNLSLELLKRLEIETFASENNDDTITLSRGDYKISERVFTEEIECCGFKIVDSKSYGPIKNIGAMVVYVLQKIN